MKGRGDIRKRGWRPSPQATSLLVNQLPSFVRRDKRENYITSSPLLNARSDANNNGSAQREGAKHPLNPPSTSQIKVPTITKMYLFKRGIKGASMVKTLDKQEQEN
jgi:hypothetical protein